MKRTSRTDSNHGETAGGLEAKSQEKYKQQHSPKGSSDCGDMEVQNSHAVAPGNTGGRNEERGPKYREAQKKESR